METLYHQTNALLEGVQFDLSRLERDARAEAAQFEKEIKDRLDDVCANIDRLDLLISKEPASRRPTSKMRADQLRYDCRHLQTALRTIQHKRQARLRLEQERDQLLTQRYTANDTHLDMAADSEPLGADLRHHGQLDSASREMDALLDSGRAALTNLRSQRGMLDGVRANIVNISRTLGLSNTVMRLIEKRTTQDKIIMIVLMLLTCFVMFLVIRYAT